MITSMQNNYLNRNNNLSKINKFENISKEDNEKISREEDEMLKNRLKEAGFDFSKQSFEFIKKQYTVVFPPDNAPGAVRRAWRQAEESASPEVREEMNNFVLFHSNFLEEYKNYKGNMPNDLMGYSDIIKDMRRYAEEYSNSNDKQGLKQYKQYSRVLDLFENELKKFL